LMRSPVWMLPRSAPSHHRAPPIEGAAGERARLVEPHGWTLVGEFSDVAISKDDRRPGFQAALVRCGQLGAVSVAGRLDRITRRAHALATTRGRHLGQVCEDARGR
jgi:hypothetical protein